MERVIKFRALCDYDAEGDAMSGMLFFDPLKCDNGIYCTPNPDDIWHINEYLSPLMQFTGLLDKNGVEIYEGDILSGFISGRYKVVEFKNGCFYTKSKADDSNYRLGGWDKSILEVVGNRYSNPELLSTQLK